MSVLFSIHTDGPLRDTVEITSLQRTLSKAPKWTLVLSTDVFYTLGKNGQPNVSFVKKFHYVYPHTYMLLWFNIQYSGKFS